MEHMDAAVPIFQRRVGPMGLDVPPAGEAEFDHLVEQYRGAMTRLGSPLQCATTSTA